MSPTLRIAIPCGLALLGVAVWHSWPAPTEEDRVREVVGAIVEGAEAGDVGDIVDHLSPRFRGTEGEESFDRDTLRSFLVGQFLRRGPISVVLGPIDVVVTGAQAHARFDATVVEREGGWNDVLPVNADGWRLEVDLTLVDHEWLVVGSERSSWTGAAPMTVVQ